MNQSIFEKILASNSMTVIEIKAENALAGADGQEKDALERILLTRKLDEIHAISNEMLGRHDEARKLREYMVKKAVSKK